MVDKVGAAGQHGTDGEIVLRTQSKAIDAENIKILLEKPGRFTLDDDGNICIVNPPRKRDNFLVSFFLGHVWGSESKRAAYREKERMLDRVVDFSQNTSFQKQIILALQGKKNEAGTFKTQQNLSVIEERLKVYVAKHKGGLSTDAIKNLNLGAQKVSAAVSMAVDKASMFCDYDKGSLVFQDRAVNVFKFINDNMPDNLRTEPLFGKNGIDKQSMAYLSQKLIGQCMISPHDFDGIGLRDVACDIQKNLKSGLGLSGNYAEKFGQNLALMLDTLKIYLAGFASQAISMGKDPTAVATALNDMINDLCKSVDYSRQSSHAIRNILNPRAMEVRIGKIANLPPQVQVSGKANKRPLEYDAAVLLQKNTGCTVDAAIRVMAWLKTKNVDAPLFEVMSRSVADDFRQVGAFVPGEKAGQSDGLKSYLNEIENMYNRLSKNLGKDVVDGKSFTSMLAALTVLNPEHREFLKDHIDSLIDGTGQTIEDAERLASVMADDKVFFQNESRKLTQLKAVLQEAKSLILSGVAGNNQHVLQLNVSSQKSWVDDNLKLMTDYIDNPGFSLVANVDQKLAAGRARIKKVFDNYQIQNLARAPRMASYLEVLLEKHNYPESSRAFARHYITVLVEQRAGAAGGSRDQIKQYMEEIAASLVNKKAVLEFGGRRSDYKRLERSITDRKLGVDAKFEAYVKGHREHFTEMKEINQKLVEEAKNMSPQEVQQQITSFYHEDFDRSARTLMIRRIGNTDLSQAAASERPELAREALKKNLGEASYLPFMSFQLGRDGILPYLQQIQKEEEDSLRRQEHLEVARFGHYELSVDKDDPSRYFVEAHYTIGLRPSLATSGRDPDDQGVKPIFAKNVVVRFPIAAGEIAYIDRVDRWASLDTEVEENFEAPDPAYGDKFL